MKNIIIYIGLLIVMMLNACIDDESTLDINTLSKIVITTESDTITQDFGFELVCKPKEITQTIEGMELSYEWACNGYSRDQSGSLTKDPLKVISHERELKYTFKSLGKYDLRLKVSNAHGSTFKYLTVFVRAAFEEGYFVLSKDQSGKGRVSFMRILSKEEIDTGKEEQFLTTAFSMVNPTYPLNDPVGACMAGLNIYLVSGNDRLLYSIDAQTFDVLGVTDFKTDFPWMKPKAMLRKNDGNGKAMVFSETGGFLWIDYYSAVAFEDYHVFPDRNHFSRYFMRNEKYYDFTFYINDEDGKVAFSYWAPYYDVVWREFPGEELIAVVMDEDRVTWTVTRDVVHPEHLRIASSGFDSSEKNPWMNPEVYEYDDPEPTLTRNSQVLCNKLYNGVLFYNHANKLYRWNTGNVTPELPDKAVITLPADCEITCFSFSPDFRQIYLGFTKGSLTGLKGCFYIYDADKIDPQTDELQLLKHYDGIADDPVQVFYKPVGK